MGRDGEGYGQPPRRSNEAAKRSSPGSDRTLSAVDIRPAVHEPALIELRRVRRHKRIANLDWIDALYHAYLAALATGALVVYTSGFLAGDDVRADALARVEDLGPAVVGAALALAVFLGLRAGGRGGPLALEEPEVMHVLLSPVDRGAALLGSALRTVRTTTFAGGVIGAVVGLLAMRPLPGSAATWIASGALVGAVAGAAFTGAALVASGRSWSRTLATAIGFAVLAAALADLVASTAYSPTGLAGRAGLWALGFDPLALIGIALLLLLPVAGIYAVGGTSLEAAKRRAGLQAQLRFAATLYDVRTVIVLRRLLAQEMSRTRPWLRLRVGRSGRRDVWRRGWHALVRWPGVRLLRLGVLGAAAGFGALGAFKGVPALIVVSGICLYLAALDAIEPLAQEVDHPQLSESYPIARPRLTLRHLAMPAAVMGLVVLVGGVAILPFAPLATVLDVTPAVMVSAGLAAACGAALSVTGEPPMMVAMRTAPSLDMLGMQVVLLAAWPPLVATAGVLPVLAARSAADSGGTVGGGAVAGAVGVITLCAGILVWINFRDRFKKARQAASA